ncbi:MAG: V-type ATP synthase subunit I [Promethearchaeota archaeon]
MLRPEKLSLLEIAIHKSQIPAFLIEVPKYKIHIKEFEENKTKKPHHLRREHSLNEEEDLDLINQKINEIEESIIYYFQTFGVDPNKIEKPPKDQRFKMIISSMTDGINKLHNQVTRETRHLKGYLKDIDACKEDIINYEILKETLIWLSEKYKTTSTDLGSFEQLEFRLFQSSQNDFNDIEINMEHEEIPVVMDFKIINENYTSFFLITHQSYHEQITDLCHNAKEITNFEVYFNEDGLNIILLEEIIKTQKERLEKNNNMIEEEKAKVSKFRSYMELLQNFKKYNLLEKQFRETYRGEIIRLKAFVPAKKQEKIANALIDKFKGKIRILMLPIEYESKRGSNPRQIKIFGEKSEDYDILEGQEGEPDLIIPTLVEPPKILKPFTLLVRLYGITSYSEIDPTIFVALTYPILFGLMFGDLGQGMVLFFVGLLIAFSKRKDKTNTMYDGGFLLMWLGIAAALGGLLYGSFFGSEEFVNPLFVNPMSNVKVVLKLTILIGVIHICLGWFIAMLNNIQNKKIYLAFADPFLKILMLIGGAIVIFKFQFDLPAWFSPDSFPPYPVLLVILPSILLLIAKPIGKLFKIPYLKKETTGELISEQAVDVGETYLSMLSNVASYSRLLALAMAHIGLMLVITVIVSMFHSWIVIAIILILGNLFVIIMESVLAAIHAMRLTYYEFFSKFYLADGIPYEYTKISSDYSVIEFGKQE